jgi:hypothetical protein
MVLSARAKDIEELDFIKRERSSVPRTKISTFTAVTKKLERGL